MPDGQDAGGSVADSYSEPGASDAGAAEAASPQSAVTYSPSNSPPASKPASPAPAGEAADPAAAPTPCGGGSAGSPRDGLRSPAPPSTAAAPSDATEDAASPRDAVSSPSPGQSPTAGARGQRDSEAGGQEKVRRAMENEAANTIQCLWRGHRQRKRKHDREAAEAEGRKCSDLPAKQAAAFAIQTQWRAHQKRKQEQTGVTPSRQPGSGRATPAASPGARSASPGARSASPGARSASPGSAQRSGQGQLVPGKMAVKPKHPLVRELLRKPLAEALRRYPRLGKFIDKDAVQADWGPHAPESLKQHLHELALRPDVFLLVLIGDEVTVASGYGTTNQGDEGRPCWGKHDGRNGRVTDIYNDGQWARVMFLGGGTANFKTDWLIRKEPSPAGERKSQGVGLDNLELASLGDTLAHPLLAARPLRMLVRETKLLRHLKKKNAQARARKQKEKEERERLDREMPMYMEKIERSDSERNLSRAIAGLRAGFEKPKEKKPAVDETEKGLSAPRIPLLASRGLEVDTAGRPHPAPHPVKPVRLHCLPVASNSPGPTYHPGLTLVRPRPAGVAFRPAHVARRDRLEWQTGVCGGCAPPQDTPGPAYRPSQTWTAGTLCIHPSCRPEKLGRDVTPGPGDYYNAESLALRPRVPAVGISRTKGKAPAPLVDTSGSARAQSTPPSGPRLRPVQPLRALQWEDLREGQDMCVVPQEIAPARRYCWATVTDLISDGGKEKVKVMWSASACSRFPRLLPFSTLTREYCEDPGGGAMRCDASAFSCSLQSQIQAIERATKGAIAAGGECGDAYSLRLAFNCDGPDEADRAVMREWADAVVDGAEDPGPAGENPPERSLGTWGRSPRWRRDDAETVPGPGQYRGVTAVFTDGLRVPLGGRINNGNIGRRQACPSAAIDPGSALDYNPGYTAVRPTSPSALCYLTG
eukprot:TRINITY_DN4708_c0_g1_i1.p1 TRINITY_DN4708_c0_g1~~TRINITY_DN4708_c0_g1_i1.p1  ORF type:complete len:930 (+),score=211.03 TRINITY_DN4708_c0_g1_i1:113-2902(+)